MDPLCGTDWGRLLASEFEQPYWDALMTFVEGERRVGPVFPPPDQVYRALEVTWCEATRVVIVGQDPYPTPGDAEGLCFSAPCGTKRPQSLVRIHAELQRGVKVAKPPHGSLMPWAHRGVLLLNTILTVRDGVPLSHQGRGWERFTSKVLQVVAREVEPVFLLMGKWARESFRNAGIGAEDINVVEVPHPVHPDFLGSAPFSEVDRRLDRRGQPPMDWRLDP